MIDLELCKNIFYSLIYSLKSFKLETLKIYIKINLINSFIWLLKFFAKDFILFVQKLNNSLSLYLDYQELNNIIIKNRYLLFLVNKLLN